MKTDLDERYLDAVEAAECAVGKKLENGRHREDNLIRFFVSYYLRSEGFTLHDIGRKMGKDHTSILHHCRVMESMMSVPMAYRQELDAYEKFKQIVCD